MKQLIYLFFICSFFLFNACGEKEEGIDYGDDIGVIIPSANKITFHYSFNILDYANLKTKDGTYRIDFHYSFNILDYANFKIKDETYRIDFHYTSNILYYANLKTKDKIYKIDFYYTSNILDYAYIR
ncbi:hypothetical protein M2451_004034 [Dysgonomonas sp. PFB1-18]|uniref:hypothetical protein n=1 Tax=unclassified Dysgonomonas TaxID=2630389 RepID=UPI002473C03F|nr:MULTISPECIES: hypothetical protein [unclassified Dysgonomonas]MDH6310198.1 hypothetical protein [Dysgonomonas sp. PF1-14]MDH6340017.1 hypothetical protein [Dysgonomonas sp. PF1-16]MDH6382687.1 hypothetical protein [Dysgonomonas sp. PFB1-18]MDH6398882.1 hypothetical protein [Dysgonomonas sp. PF1-23]